MITGPKHLFVARCRERGYQLSAVMPCVVKQDGDRWTIDTEHHAYPRRRCSQPDKPPSTVKKVCAWIKAVNRWMLAGKPIRTDDEVASLVAICKHCKYFSDKGRCRACGCAVTKGAWAVTNKARMATEQCPKGKWPLVGASAQAVHGSPPTNSMAIPSRLFAPPAINQELRVETKQHPEELARAMAEVAKITPNAFVEIGVHAGGSLLRYASACAPNAIVIGIDPGKRREARQIPAVIERLCREGYDAHWIKGLSQSPDVIQEARRLLAGRPIDCLHIDGSHSYGDVLADWRNWAPLVRPGGMVIFHDVASRSNGVPEVWAKCRRGRRSMEIILSEVRRKGRIGTGIIWLDEPLGTEAETVQREKPPEQKQPDTRLSSIITACGQHDLVVAHALACQRSSRPPDEIIVVNDGGDPGLLADLLKQEWTTRVVYARIAEDIPWNQAGARNLGIWLSSGDVLAIEDADHIPSRQLYDAALRYLERTPATASVKPRRIPVRLADLPRLTALEGGKLEHTGSATVIVRRDAICAVKGYDEDYAGHYGCDDTDSRERIARVGRCHATFSPGYFHVTDGSTIGLVKGKDLANYRLRQKKRRENRGVGPLLRFGYRATVLPQAAPRLRITAIMPARQEGEQVRLTCESFLAAGVDEIIVIDDGSTDGSCAGLPDGVKVIRNAKPQGVGRARNQGAAVATGNVLIFADAHERALTSLRPFAQAALDRGAILCAAVKPLDTGSKGPGGRGDWTGYGARKILDKDAVAYKEGWILKRPKERYSPLDALIGACYAVPREVFDRMGGWIETRQWGYNEQAFSIKAWFCGVPMLVDRDTVIRHEFKRRFKYPCSRSGSQLNRWHVHAVLFEPDTFERIWAPRFAKAFGSRVEAMARALLAEPGVQAEIADFHRRKVRTDAEFLAAFPPGKIAGKATSRPRDRHVRRAAAVGR